MKILLINSDEGPDYLPDLVNYFFLSGKYKVYTNYIPNFLFNDYAQKDKLYGRGFSLYGKYLFSRRHVKTDSPFCGG